ncbi:MAG TPA: YrdB family protein [Geodermatophilus sp.]|nr:YrdB family protein [Geodermatophilus sp.]
MTSAWQWTWALVALASELAALAALAYWGFSAGGTPVSRWLLGVGVPVTAAVLWGLFAAPQAVVQVAVLAVVTKVVVFGAAAAALLVTGSPRLAAVLAVAAVLGAVLSAPLTGPAPDVPVSAPASR